MATAGPPLMIREEISGIIPANSVARPLHPPFRTISKAAIILLIPADTGAAPEAQTAMRCSKGGASSGKEPRRKRRAAGMKPKKHSAGMTRRREYGRSKRRVAGMKKPSAKKSMRMDGETSPRGR